MMRLLPRVWALSTTGQGGSGVVVAGSRAGGLGILDLGVCADEDAARRTLCRISALLKDRAFGLRVPAGDRLESMLDDLPENLRLVIVVEGRGVDWGASAAALGRSGRVAAAEVTSRT